jgi:protein involved in polysaccharide export with SLBB domain
MRNHLKIYWILGFIAFLLISEPIATEAQKLRYLDNSFISGARKYQVDTLSMEHASQIVKESEGLLEREIDPEQYMVGPSDVFTIMIMASKPLNFPATISPEGRLLIPSVGAVDLKGKTLAEAEEMILERIKSVYNSAEIVVALKKLRQFKVIVSGEVNKEVTVPATAADRVSQVLEKAGGVKYDASVRHIRIVRKGEKENLHADLVRYYNGDDEYNPTVLGGDIIIVPKSNEKNVIGISGEVGTEGYYEYVEGDSLSTILRISQGFKNSAYLDSVEISWKSIKADGVNRVYLDLSSWKDILFTQRNLPGDVPLNSGDRVYIREIPNRDQPSEVVVEGEVKFPGKYLIEKDSIKLADFLRNAGGFTENASIKASVIYRRQDVVFYNPELERLKRIPNSEMTDDERRYFQAKIKEHSGKMSVDFTKVLSDPYSKDNVTLMDEDSIYVPRRINFVSVQGRVKNPGLVHFNPNYDYLDYINMVGGYGQNADEGETIIVKSSGARFNADDDDYIIEPGDDILVPPISDTDFMEILQISLGILTQIVALVAIVMNTR